MREGDIQLEQLTDSQAKTHAMNQQNKMRNYLTNTDMDIADDAQRLSWEDSNNIVKSIWETQQATPGRQLSDEELYAIMQGNGNYYNFASNYGGSTASDARWRDAFTVHPRAQVVQAARQAAANYGAYQDQLAQDKEAQGRAAVAERNKAADKFTASNGVEYNIPRAFSDYTKNWSRAYKVAQTKKQQADEALTAVLADKNATKEQKEAAQAAAHAAQEDVTRLAQELNAKMEEAEFFDKGGVVSSVEDIIARGGAGATDVTGRYTGEASVEELLSRAMTREDEVYTPEQDNRTWLEKWSEQEQRRLQLERDKEQQRINRARTREGFAGLAATIGDMIRASEGAPVAPRDWQRIYDNLTAQEKANINNYQVRMQKLHDDIKADRDKREAAAAAAAKAQAERDFKLKLQLQQQGWKSGEDDKNRDLKWRIANLKDKKDRYMYYLRWGQPADKTKTHTLILLGDRAMAIPKGQTFTNAVNSINRILASESSYKSGVKVDISLLKNSPELEKDPQAFYNRNSQFILAYNWNDLTDEAKKQIEKNLKNFEGEWMNDTTTPVRRDNKDGESSEKGEDGSSGEDKKFDPNDLESWF